MPHMRERSEGARSASRAGRLGTDSPAERDRRPKSFEVSLTDALVPATAADRTTRRMHWLCSNHASASRRSGVRPVA